MAGRPCIFDSPMTPAERQARRRARLREERRGELADLEDLFAELGETPDARDLAQVLNNALNAYARRYSLKWSLIDEALAMLHQHLDGVRPKSETEPDDDDATDDEPDDDDDDGILDANVLFSVSKKWLAAQLGMAVSTLNRRIKEDNPDFNRHITKIIRAHHQEEEEAEEEEEE